MIRDRLRRLARRLTEGEPAPRPAPAARPADPPPVREPEDEPMIEIEGPELREKVASGLAPVFLDIREPYEVAGGYLEGALLIPMNQVPGRLAELPRDRTLIVYCAAGVRSYGVTHWLREQGFAETWSLVGGMHAWLEQGGTLARPER